MLLLIDAGNTRIKWALAALAAPGAVAGTWIDCGALAHDQVGTLARQWQSVPVGRVLVSNVAGAALRTAIGEQLLLLRDACGAVPAVDWFASDAVVAGVQNLYQNPARLGCDRLAALIGARARWPGRALVVATCGTATTVDALTADGRFIGGMILPGLGVMAASLAQRTAQLPSVSAVSAVSALQPPGSCSPLLADNTEDAIRSGCLAAQAGAIERAVAAHGNAHCVLAGGAAAWVRPYLGHDVTLVDNLVLIGLHAVAIERSAPGKAACRPGTSASSNIAGTSTPC